MLGAPRVVVRGPLMPSLYALVVAVLTLDTALLALLVWAYHSPRFASRRIGGGPPMRVTWPHRLRTMSVTSTLSLASVFGVTYALHDSLLHTRDTSWWAVAGQTLAILFVYDFLYYFLHRAMHHPKLLRWVHGMHHRARNPSALESFYQHPIELLSGLGLLFLSTWIVGPVHELTFAATFLVYSTFNIVVHAGLESHVALLAPLDFLIRKHHAHHAADPRKNYSSLTPLPDWLFGTAL